MFTFTQLCRASKAEVCMLALRFNRSVRLLFLRSCNCLLNELIDTFAKGAMSFH